jgi:hypothetical protein
VTIYFGSLSDPWEGLWSLSFISFTINPPLRVIFNWALKLTFRLGVILIGYVLVEEPFKADIKVLIHKMRSIHLLAEYVSAFQDGRYSKQLVISCFTQFFLRVVFSPFAVANRHTDTALFAHCYWTHQRIKFQDREGRPSLLVMFVFKFRR